MNWKELYKEEFQKDYFKKITSFLVEDGKQHTIYPPHKDVLNAFTFTPLDKVKTVIIGQDPYYGANQAHGLSFSVLPDQEIPPSLKNIYKEINSDLGINHQFPHGFLLNWATQGVLLLNTTLTVRAGMPASHRNIGWETFTDRIIQVINEQDRPIVYMLWGSFAKGKRILITNPGHLILEASHPSPLSAYNGFFGCKHFSKANNFLTNNNIQPINWLI